MSDALHTAYHDQQRALRGNLDEAVMVWAREHAQTVPLGVVLVLIASVQDISAAHARDLFDLGRNADAIKNAG